jgi:4-hydroxy-3-polyprenylbenzoate decarboxylase
MATSDLRDWIALLEREGELVRVGTEVDPHLEVTEIVTRTIRSGGPALLFENPKGSSHSLLVNQFGTERRMCLALGVERLDDAATKLADVLEMQPPQGLGEKLRGLKQLKSIADSPPRTVRKGACQEIVLEGDDVDLGRLPVQTCWPGDAGPFITLPAVITRDPRDGKRNVGMYRMQVLGPRATAMHWQLHKDGRADYRATDGRMEVAVALGLDPVSAYAASAPLPKHIDELMFAGLLRGEPVDVVKGVTIDLEVPANAEIVLEGYVEQGDLTEEGPFGDHTGYYNERAEFPVLTIDRMTMRREPIYHTTYTGKPPDEPAVLAVALNEVFVPLLQRQFPEILDFHLPPEGCSYRMALVRIRKAYPGHGRRIMMGVWSSLRQFMYTKFIVVVDEDVDVRDWREVVWAITTRMDPARDTMLVEHTPIDYLDFASPVGGLGSKMGLDATNKWPGETQREWGRPIAMDAAVTARVEHILSSLGV